MGKIAQGIVIAAALGLLIWAVILLYKASGSSKANKGAYLFMGPNNVGRVDSPQPTLYGGAEVVQDWLWLNTETANSLGTAYWSVFPGTHWTLSFVYQTGVPSGSTTVGDGTWFSVYRDTADLNFADINGKSGYSIGFVERSNNLLRLSYAGNVLASVTGLTFADGQKHQIRFDCVGGSFLVYLDGKIVLSYTDPLFGIRAEVTNRVPGCVFGAWTTDQIGHHAVQSVILQPL